jgi:hypothetical protein
MTKKDYLLIAQAIAETWCHFESQKAIAENLATALENTNPLFDKTKFLVACGVTQPTEKRKARK